MAPRGYRHQDGVTQSITTSISCSTEANNNGLQGETGSPWPTTSPHVSSRFPEPSTVPTSSGTEEGFTLDPHRTWEYWKRLRPTCSEMNYQFPSFFFCASLFQLSLGPENGVVATVMS
jgi:hypothetical protein